MRIQRREGGETLHGGARRQSFNIIDSGTEPDVTCSLYTVEPGDRIGAHFHPQRTEVWFLVSGTGIVRLDDETREVSAGTAIMIAPGTVHGLENNMSEALSFVAFATPRPIKGPDGRNLGTVELG